MKEKLLDAQLDQKHIKGEFLRSKGRYQELVKKNSLVDVIFNNIMKYEVGKLWQEGKEKNRQKVKFLCSKWKKSKDQISEIRGVKYRDEDLDVEISDKNEEAVVYGKATVSENMSESKIHGLQPNLFKRLRCRNREGIDERQISTHG